MLKRWISVFLCVLGFAAPIRAVQEEEKPKAWYDRLDFAGDLRLRYEGFNWEGQFDEGRRDRLRYRFRVGFDIELTKSIRSGFRLRSGDPKDPVSDNQTFGGGLDKDGISLAEFYADEDAADVLGRLRWPLAPPLVAVRRQVRPAPWVFVCLVGA